MATVEIPDPTPVMFTFIIKSLPGAPKAAQFHEYVDIPYRLMKDDVIYLPTLGKDVILVSGANINMTAKRQRSDYPTYEWKTVANEFDEHGTIFFARYVDVIDE